MCVFAHLLFLLCLLIFYYSQCIFTFMSKQTKRTPAVQIFHTIKDLTFRNQQRNNLLFFDHKVKRNKTHKEAATFFFPLLLQTVPRAWRTMVDSTTQTFLLPAPRFIDRIQLFLLFICPVQRASKHTLSLAPSCPSPSR